MFNCHTASQRGSEIWLNSSKPGKRGGDSDSCGLCTALRYHLLWSWQQRVGFGCAGAWTLLQPPAVALPWWWSWLLFWKALFRYHYCSLLLLLLEGGGTKGRKIRFQGDGFLIIIIIIKKISRELHLILGLKTLHNSTRLFRTATQQQQQEQQSEWRYPKESTVDNGNDSEAIGGRERNNNNKKTYYTLAATFCGKRDRTFCDSAVHGKEMGFEGLSEWGCCLWISDVI